MMIHYYFCTDLVFRIMHLLLYKMISLSWNLSRKTNFFFFKCCSFQFIYKVFTIIKLANADMYSIFTKSDYINKVHVIILTLKYLFDYKGFIIKKKYLRIIKELIWFNSKQLIIEMYMYI